jgi:hypothetical protein
VNGHPAPTSNTIMRMRRLIPFLCLLPTLALAQSTSDVSGRVEREHACLVDVHARITRLKSLFEDAKKQLARAPAGSDAHRDAARTIEVLEGRLSEAARDLLDCMPRQASAPVERRVEVVQTGEGGSMVRESGRQKVAEHVFIVQGERVDGRGQHPHGVITRAVVAQATMLARCHDDLAHRRAFERGALSLVFTIDERGATRDVAVEGATIGDAAFRNCVRAAGERLRAPVPQGGAARYAFELHFGDAD